MWRFVSSGRAARVHTGVNRPAGVATHADDPAEARARAHVSSRFSCHLPPWPAAKDVAASVCPFSWGMGRLRYCTLYQRISTSCGLGRVQLAMGP
jgi:hypothetical protein